MSTARIAALQRLLPPLDVDALLVTDLVNIAYLCGFTGSNAALVVPVEGEAVLVTDARYTERAKAEAPDLEIVLERAAGAAAARTAAERGARRLGFEAEHVTVAAHGALIAAAGAAGLCRTTGLVEQLRAVKDDAEIAALRTACEIADAALSDLLAAGGLTEGRTEREIARDLEDRIRGLGSPGPSFDTIVAAGPHSAVPHHAPTDTPLRRGDLVVVDFGALERGYHSDTTRTFVVGPAAPWQRDLHALVAESQQRGREAVAPGADVTAVDAAARDWIRGAGHGDDFPHGLGHGVGLQIHEQPWIVAKGTGELAECMVVTVEPGVYLSGRGGVRIEDTLVVRGGEPEALTRLPRELIEV
ncbi:Xaa-Pro aminopeptidase [Pseudonocardia thermophila]|uniref:Xaa-Pro aminopeptidase n=1 Tax=Pseudonocardia thermophila TaxID=1848 RepID=A0A1M6NBY6_PSETH|nr:Xaa-Pro peptidase family protein [Pseudonocardia thermophila]SHJ93248.1 Xaa-Pro aminopeptidase [Pseudonocardia thermophila]